VRVGVGVNVRVGVTVTVIVGVGVNVRVGVAVNVRVGVAVNVRVGLGVNVGVGLAISEKNAVTERSLFMVTAVGLTLSLLVPDQEFHFHPDAGFAVRVTTVPGAYPFAGQPPELGGWFVIDPLPLTLILSV